MGTFNTLLANVQCSNCGGLYEGGIQFKYSEVWQHTYQLGDTLRWGKNNIGSVHDKRVIVYGILEVDLCLVCHQENKNNEFDIHIADNTIVGISVMKDYAVYMSSAEGNFHIPE